MMLLETNITYWKVVFLVSNVHLRCGLPFSEQMDACIHVGVKCLAFGQHDNALCTKYLPFYHWLSTVMLFF